jgi:uncharacterized protein
MLHMQVAELVREIACLLVDQPEAVEINEKIDNENHTIELRVAKTDLGKIIGKNGSHAQALRTLLMAASGKFKKRILLVIADQ